MAVAGGYAEVFPELARIAEGDPAREVCGFVVADSTGRLSVVVLPNVAESPRDRFLVDPAAHLALARRLRTDGGRIAAAFHSHVDGPARLSDEDLREALADGEPVMPGVDLIVVGVRSGIVQEIKVFEWRSTGFAEADGMARRVATDAPGAKSRPS